jgi:hypothetical protein
LKRADKKRAELQEKAHQEAEKNKADWKAKLDQAKKKAKEPQPQGSKSAEAKLERAEKGYQNAVKRAANAVPAQQSNPQSTSAAVFTNTDGSHDGDIHVLGVHEHQRSADAASSGPGHSL